MSCSQSSHQGKISCRGVGPVWRHLSALSCAPNLRIKSRANTNIFHPESSIRDVCHDCPIIRDSLPDKEREDSSGTLNCYALRNLEVAVHFWKNINIMKQTLPGQHYVNFDLKRQEIYLGLKLCSHDLLRSKWSDIGWLFLSCWLNNLSFIWQTPGDDLSEHWPDD